MSLIYIKPYLVCWIHITDHIYISIIVLRRLTLRLPVVCMLSCLFPCLCLSDWMLFAAYPLPWSPWKRGGCVSLPGNTWSSSIYPLGVKFYIYTLYKRYLYFMLWFSSWFYRHEHVLHVCQSWDPSSVLLLEFSFVFLPGKGDLGGFFLIKIKSLRPEGIMLCRL